MLNNNFQGLVPGDDQNFCNELEPANQPPKGKFSLKLIKSLLFLFFVLVFLGAGVWSVKNQFFKADTYTQAKSIAFTTEAQFTNFGWQNARLEVTNAGHDVAIKYANSSPTSLNSVITSSVLEAKSGDSRWIKLDLFSAAIPSANYQNLLVQVRVQDSPDFSSVDWNDTLLTSQNLTNTRVTLLTSANSSILGSEVGINKTGKYAQFRLSFTASGPEAELNKIAIRGLNLSYQDIQSHSIASGQNSYTWSGTRFDSDEATKSNITVDTNGLSIARNNAAGVISKKMYLYPTGIQTNAHDGEGPAGSDSWKKINDTVGDIPYSMESSVYVNDDEQIIDKNRYPRGNGTYSTGESYYKASFSGNLPLDVNIKKIKVSVIHSASTNARDGVTKTFSIDAGSDISRVLTGSGSSWETGNINVSTNANNINQINQMNIVFAVGGNSGHITTTLYSIEVEVTYESVPYYENGTITMAKLDTNYGQENKNTRWRSASAVVSEYPDGSTIKIQYRTVIDARGLNSPAIPFSDPVTLDHTGGDIDLSFGGSGQYIQFKITLVRDTVTGITPKLRSLTVNFTIPSLERKLAITPKPIGGKITGGTDFDCGSVYQESSPWYKYEVAQKCEKSYSTTTNVTLTASPHTRFAFVRWNGACSGTSAVCNVSVDSVKNVSAEFEELVKLTVTKPLNSVISHVNFTDMNCGRDVNDICIIYVRKNTDIVLKSTPITGYTTQRWSVAPSPVSKSGQDTSQLTLRINQDTTVEPSVAIVTKTYSLTVDPIPTGGKIISGDVINCGEGGNGACSANLPENSEVVILGSPSLSYSFSNWLGDCALSALSDKSCQLKMTANKKISASFAPLRTITISPAPKNGSITSDPPRIFCDQIQTLCSEKFSDLEDPKLIATPAAGYVFDKWIINDRTFTQNPIGVRGGNMIVEGVFKKAETGARKLSSIDLSREIIYEGGKTFDDLQNDTNITVNLNGPAEKEITISVTATGGANPVTDYQFVPNGLTNVKIPAGQTSASFQIKTLNTGYSNGINKTVEPDEKINLTFRDTSVTPNVVSTKTVTIKDNDFPIKISEGTANGTIVNNTLGATSTTDTCIFDTIERLCSFKVDPNDGYYIRDTLFVKGNGDNTIIKHVDTPFFDTNNQPLQNFVYTLDNIESSAEIRATFAEIGKKYWDGHAGVENWASATNWSGNVKPLETDSVYYHNDFESARKNSNGATGKVKELNIAGYPGKITSSNNLEITENLTQSSGEFVGGENMIVGKNLTTTGGFTFPANKTTLSGTTKISGNITVPNLAKLEYLVKNSQAALLDFNPTNNAVFDQGEISAAVGLTSDATFGFNLSNRDKLGFKFLFVRNIADKNLSIDGNVLPNVLRTLEFPLADGAGKIFFGQEQSEPIQLYGDLLIRNDRVRLRSNINFTGNTADWQVFSAKPGTITSKEAKVVRPTTEGGVSVESAYYFLNNLVVESGLFKLNLPTGGDSFQAYAVKITGPTAKFYADKGLIYFGDFEQQEGEFVIKNPARFSLKKMAANRAKTNFVFRVRNFNGVANKFSVDKVVLSSNEDHERTFSMPYTIGFGEMEITKTDTPTTDSTLRLAGDNLRVTGTLKVTNKSNNKFTIAGENNLQISVGENLVFPDTSSSPIPDESYTGRTVFGETPNQFIVNLGRDLQVLDPTSDPDLSKIDSTSDGILVNSTIRLVYHKKHFATDIEERVRNAKIIGPTIMDDSSKNAIFVRGDFLADGSGTTTKGLNSKILEFGHGQLFNFLGKFSVKGLNPTVNKVVILGDLKICPLDGAENPVLPISLCSDPETPGCQDSEFKIQNFALNSAAETRIENVKVSDLYNINENVLAIPNSEEGCRNYNIEVSAPSASLAAKASQTISTIGAAASQAVSDMVEAVRGIITN